MKAYTDLEQSKKLAEILPLESADIILTLEGNSELTSYPIMRNYSEFYNYLRMFEFEDEYIKRTYIPAWSLVALISILPRIDIEKEICVDDTYDYRVKAYIDDGYVGDWFDDPIDACYDMIITLYKDKLL